MQEYYNQKSYAKNKDAKIKVITNNNERELKFLCLYQPDNLVNVLIIRRDAFNLVESYNFAHEEVLSLLTPSYFKIRIIKIFDSLIRTANKWNHTWNKHVKE